MRLNKHLQQYITVFLLLLPSLFYAQGTLTNLVFDATVEQGETGLTFQFDYTASAAGTVEWQLVPANPDGTPDFSGNIVYMTMPVSAAATETTETFNYDIQASAAMLPDGYTWAGKVTIGGVDSGYNDVGNLVQVTPGAVAPELTSLVFDATVEQGETSLTFQYDYTSPEVCDVEWQLVPANADGSPNYGGGNIVYVNTTGLAAANPASTQSFTFDIPANAAVLANGYTWAGKITYGGADYAYNNTNNIVQVTPGAVAPELTSLIFDATVEQGQTSLTFQYDYTSPELCNIEWQLVPANADGSPNYGGGSIAYVNTLDLAAADPASTQSFTFDIPGNAAVLADGYTWAGKITYGGMDYAYNNINNLVDVTAAPPPVNNTCSSPIELANGGSGSLSDISFTGATSSNMSDAGCAFLGSGDLFYEIVTDDDPAQETITIIATPSGGLTVAIYAYESCSGTMLGCVTGSEDTETELIITESQLQGKGEVSTRSGPSIFVRVDHMGSGTMFLESESMVLPIVINSFEAQAKGDINVISWETAQEVNNDYQILQYSNNGERWEDLEMIKAQGDSGYGANYMVKHLFPERLTYYRINAVDLDGSSDVSGIINVSRNTAENSIGRLSPNPTNGLINFTIKQLNNENVNISVINTSGNLVYSESRKINTENTLVNLNLIDMPEGLYFLKIESNTINSIQKIVKR